MLIKERGEYKLGIEFNNQQIYALYDIENWWYNRNELVYNLSGGAGTGKAQPMDTLIPTPNGDIKLGDLKVGDYVFNRYGKPVKILAIYDRGELDVYKVTFEDGRSTLCNDEHLWSYYTSKGNLKTSTLREMMKKPLISESSGRYRYAIPQSQCVVYTTKTYDIDPYVIGVFIRNGCYNLPHLTLSFDDEDVVEEVTKLIHAKSYKKCSNDNYNYTFKLSDDIRDEYIKKYHIRTECELFLTHIFFENIPELIGTCNRQRIPYQYFYGDKSQRWSLIQGLFDTGGSISDDLRASISYDTVNVDLACDIKRLLASLGVSSTISTHMRNRRGKDEIYYTLYVKCDSISKPNFFRLQRKKNIAIAASNTKKRHDYTKTYVYNIENMGYKTSMRCIYVDDIEHLYLTNDYIVTHNTTLIRYFIERIGLELSDVAFVAYMGKAACQMARNGLPAQTIHSFIYDCEKIVDLDDEGHIQYNEHGKIKMKYVFVKKERLIKDIKLIVLDEASTVNKEIASDLLSYGIPIIALGDLNQLPPVFGKPYFLTNPNFILTQVMRQSEGNPIVWLAHRALNGLPLQNGIYGKCIVADKSDLNPYVLRRSDVVLTGTNKLRHEINTLFRENLLNLKKTEIPNLGEKIICRKNNWSRSIADSIYLTNGMSGTIEYLNFESFNGKSMQIDFRPDFINKKFKNLKIDYKKLMSLYTDDELSKGRLSYNMDEFEFAYAITVHLSQGSQYQNVVLLDECAQFNDDIYKKLMYTGITRASDIISIYH